MRAKLRAPAGLGAVVFLVLIGLFLAAPLAMLGLRSLTDDDGAFTLAHYAAYIGAPGLRSAILGTVEIGLGVCLVVLPAALAYAYALERSRLPFKGVWSAVASVPLLAPSLLPALALVYLFGRQGLLTPWLGGWTIYGPQGILIADAVAAFPHAVIILRTALGAADGRLQEQARLLGAGPWRRFWRLTLPNARHGLISAAFVVFALTAADVGAPKVVGGDFNVLALDIYKKVIGQQDFQTGAVIAIFLLVPSLLAIGFERWAAARQSAMASTRATVFVAAPGPVRDAALTALCGVVGLIVVGLLLVCQFAALVRQWPYDLRLSLAQYDLDKVDGGGWAAVIDSVGLALTVAAIGAPVAFLGAYVLERGRAAGWLRGAGGLFTLAPAATPGLALGLAYILFFDEPANPLFFLYGTPLLLGLATFTHFYTVAHLTSVSALKAVDRDIEPAAALLGRGEVTVLARVIMPICAPAMLEIAVYLFINVMTTVSVALFLSPPDFSLAAVAVLNMDDAGDEAPAAAMGMLIVYVNLLARVSGSVAFKMISSPKLHKT